jgi:type I restriction enzyme M protein
MDYHRFFVENFNGCLTAIPENLGSFASTARLVDMLDFSRTTFEKQISLAVQKMMSFTSQWPVEKLGDVAEIIAGQSPESSFYNDQGIGLPFFQGKKDFGDIFLKLPTAWTTQTTKISVCGDILMSVRAPVGDVNLNPLDQICIGRGLAVIRGNSKINSKYLYEFIDQNKFLFKGNQGATFESISTSDLREKRVPLPPLEVQQQIVAECEVIDLETENARTALALASQSIADGIAEIYAGKHPQKKLEEISEIKRGRFTHRPRNDPKFFGGDYPFIQTGDVVKATASKVPYTQTLNEDGLAVSKLFQPPVVLITIAANIGDTAVLDYPACFTDSVVGLTPQQGINARFLELMMRAQKQHLNDIAPQMAQKNINVEILKPITVPIPTPEEQDRFVAKVEALERAIADAQTIINDAPAKKQAVMNKHL